MESSEHILQEAIARNAAMVVSLPSAGMLRHHKSRFLGEDAGGGGFWVEAAPGDEPLIDQLIQSTQPVGVSFKSGVNKVVFTSPIKARQAEFRLNDTTMVPALLIQSPDPDAIKTSQRRSSYRVTVPPDAECSVRMWRIGEQADLKARPMAATELMCRLLDISTGGIGVLVSGKDGVPAHVTPEDRLRIDIWSPKGTITLEGRMRHPTALKDPSVRAGIQFRKLENDMEDRKTLAQLTKIIGELQRQETRRIKLGLARTA